MKNLARLKPSDVQLIPFRLIHLGAGLCTNRRLA
jgi:hypothetical protein